MDKEIFDNEICQDLNVKLKDVLDKNTHLHPIEEMSVLSHLMIMRALKLAAEELVKGSSFDERVQSARKGLELFNKNSLEAFDKKVEMIKNESFKISSRRARERFFFRSF